ncbi:hypothetical protein ACC702_39065, partial [Rhizobium ruizarguesonis]
MFPADIKINRCASVSKQSWSIDDDQDEARPREGVVLVMAVAMTSSRSTILPKLGMQSPSVPSTIRST